MNSTNGEKIALFTMQRRWTAVHMPRVARMISELPDLDGVRLACSMHLDIKMIPFVAGVLAKGAAVYLTTCNPTTVRDEVVAYLVGKGAQAHAWRDMPAAAYDDAIQRAIAWQPTHLCEMGAAITAVLHQTPPDPFPPIRAGLEATGSGITALAGLTPRYPIFNWDDVPVKEGLHNRHMVGLTTWHTFFARTQLSLHEKEVLVVGYGLVGQGVAASARAFGGHVTIADNDPERQMAARFDGWAVRPLAEAILEADVIVTATGAANVISAAHLPLLRDGVFLLNVGHLPHEIDVAALAAFPHEEVLPFIEAYDVNGRTVYLLAGGSMFNLTAGDGDSLNGFDITLAVMAAGFGHIVGAGETAVAGLHLLPDAVWRRAL